MNINVPQDASYRKFTETDQLLHVLGVAMIQAHGLHKGINRYPANVPEKKLKQERKELLWCSRLSSYKIESIQEGVKPCTT